MPPAARNLLVNLSPRGRAVLGASLLGAVVLAFLLFQLASRPSFATIASGLDPADTGKATAALDERGVAYELRNNGTALAVEKAQSAQARIALAEGGIAGSEQPGFELFDEQKLGASEFQQQVTYQRALEGQIARTVQEVNGVGDVQVRLALPEDQLFEDTETPATAAVLLSGGANLDGGAVRGIAQLVSSSVEGLKPDKVSITDGSGQLLWPKGEGGTAGGSMAKMAAQARYEQRMEASLSMMLARAVGPDKAEVQVTADINADEATRDELRYADEGTPVREQEETEQLESEGGAGAAPAGAEGNIPSYAAGAGGGESNYERDSGSTDYAIDKTVTRTRIAPGTVEQLDVAVLVDRSVPPGDLQALQDAVASAAGVDEGRGDTLSVQQVAFAKPPAPPGTGPLDAATGYAKYAGLAAALLVFLGLTARHLKRREEEGLMREPTWLREIEQPTRLAELEGNGTPRADLPEVEVPQARAQVEQLAEREPERVAQQVRAWMQE